MPENGNSIQKPLRSRLFSLSRQAIHLPLYPGTKGKMIAGTGMVCGCSALRVCVSFVFAVEFQELDAVAQASLAFLSLTVDGC